MHAPVPHICRSAPRPHLAAALSNCHLTTAQPGPSMLGTAAFALCMQPWSRQLCSCQVGQAGAAPEIGSLLLSLQRVQACHRVLGRPLWGQCASGGQSLPLPGLCRLLAVTLSLQLEERRQFTAPDYSNSSNSGIQDQLGRDLWVFSNAWLAWELSYRGCTLYMSTWAVGVTLSTQ